MSWTPKSEGQYAGTCIFLILFAVLFRALLGFRINFFPILKAIRERKNRDLIHSYPPEKIALMRPWRANEAVMLATIDVVIAGCGYLLYVPLLPDPRLWDFC
jgi:hypothetical protein